MNYYKKKIHLAVTSTKFLLLQLFYATSLMINENGQTILQALIEGDGCILRIHFADQTNPYK